MCLQGHRSHKTSTAYVRRQYSRRPELLQSPKLTQRRTCATRQKFFPLGTSSARSTAALEFALVMTSLNRALHRLCIGALPWTISLHARVKMEDAIPTLLVLLAL